MSDMFDKAKDLLGKHGDAVDDAVDKATDMVDDKTGGKYTEHLETVDKKVDEVTDGLAKD
jgi:hypothetical protein